MSAYWQTPEEMGITSQEVNDICERLWKEANERSNRTCPDCGVKPGEIHLVNCDVARCTKCGGQRLSCDCEDEEGGDDVWTGLWPGYKECYERKLICFHDHWLFDLNTLATL